MSEGMIAALITACASVICQVIISDKTKNLMEYRIDRLEEKITELHGFTERICKVEERERLNSRRIDAIEVSDRRPAQRAVQ